MISRQFVVTDGSVWRPEDATAVMWRIVDIGLAACSLLVLGPVMLLITLALVLEGGFPVIFTQTRLGVRGKPFRLLKFRKFARDVGSGPSITLHDDRRLTRVGRLLERTKLDELPQLWNIVRGDMAIVGPRPESLAFAECFNQELSAVLAYKPGIFGPCQVFFRDESLLYAQTHQPEDFYRKVLFPLKANVDLAYFGRRTIAVDLRWIVHGVVAVAGMSPLTYRVIPSVLELEASLRSVGWSPA